MDDDEVTRRVAPEDQATPGAAEDPEKTELVSNGGAFPAVPFVRPPSAGEEQNRHIPNQGQQPPQPAANPGRPVAPPPQASPSGPPPWGPASSGPRPHYGPPPSPPPSGNPGSGYGAPPPGFGPGGPGPAPGPGPHQQYAPGNPNPYNAPPGFHPPPATGGPSIAGDASSLLAKGGSFITTLMHRGIRGELIRQPGFQNMRQQSPDQMVYVSYGIGLLFALLLSLLPSFVGTLLADVVWAGLAYLLFAIGSKKAHQFIAYGIGLVGAVLALLSALFSIAAFVDLASLNLAGAALTLVLGIVITLVSGLALAYLGIQVHREVKRLSTSG